MPEFVTSMYVQPTASAALTKSNGLKDFRDSGIVSGLRGLLRMLEVRSWKMSER